MRILLLIIFIANTLAIQAQDYLSTPTTNPLLFESERKEKLTERYDTIIFNFDTLSLPFIDDFSADHLPKAFRDLDFSKAKDSTYYKYYLGTSPIQDSLPYSLDSTFIYQIGTTGDTIGVQTNNIIFLNESDLSVYPPTFSPITAFEPYNVFDTIGAGSDTIFFSAFIRQDSIRFYDFPKDTNAWYTDRKVYLNQSFSHNAPTIGMMTFDGLNEFGEPYILDLNQTQVADYLTSVPLDLGAISNPNRVYFSFFYQPKGIAINGPDQGDSLVLEFFNPDTRQWGKAWATDVVDSTEQIDSFIYAIVPVKPIYQKVGFRFRFRAYAQASGAYDNWHIDYIYLDENRDSIPLILNDLGYIRPPSRLLKDYSVMPWWHFKSNPSNYQADSVFTSMRNFRNQNLNVYYRLRLLDTAANSNYYVTPGSNDFLGIQSLGKLNMGYAVNYTYEPDSINGPGTLDAHYNLDLRPSPNDPGQLVTSNDTIKTGIELQNYYAYDDGTAEAGYGVNPILGTDGYVSYISQKFEIPFPDTIGGVYIYFLPTNPDIRNQKFSIMVWRNLNNASVIYQQPETVDPIYTPMNGFVPYMLDSNIEVGQIFYIGIRSVGQNSMNIGYDLNFNNKDKINWSFNGDNWFEPSSRIFNGTLMIRPIFRKKRFEVGIKENSSQNHLSKLEVYPNPAKDVVYLDVSSERRIKSINIYDVSSRLVKTLTERYVVNTSDMNKGVYFINVTLDNDEVLTRKLLVVK